MSKVCKKAFGLKLCIFMLLLLATSYNSMAQCDPAIDPFCDDPDIETPLDSGVVFLIIASMAFGVFAIRKKKLDEASGEMH